MSDSFCFSVSYFLRPSFGTLTHVLESCTREGLIGSLPRSARIPARTRASASARAHARQCARMSNAIERARPHTRKSRADRHKQQQYEHPSSVSIRKSPKSLRCTGEDIRIVKPKACPPIHFTDQSDRQLTDPTNQQTNRSIEPPAQPIHPSSASIFTTSYTHRPFRGRSFTRARARAYARNIPWKQPPPPHPPTPTPPLSLFRPPRTQPPTSSFGPTSPSLRRQDTPCLMERGGEGARES